VRAVEETVAARLSAPVAATALAFRAFGADGSVLGLTDHDEDLSFLGTTFRADPGMTAGPLKLGSDLAPDHADIETPLSPLGLTEEAAGHGTFTDGRAELWRVDTEDPAARIMLAAGTVGEIARAEGAALIEFRGAAHALGRVTGRVYQKSCDAALGDRRCGVDLSAGFSSKGALVRAEGLSLVVEGLSLAPELLAGGMLRAEGRSRPIRTAARHAEGVALILWERSAAPPAPGTEVSVTAGCDKRFETCVSRFRNAARFRGFPTIPGNRVLSVKGGEG